MSLECSECEMDLRGGHDQSCSRCPKCKKCKEPMVIDDDAEEWEYPYYCIKCNGLVC